MIPLAKCLVQKGVRGKGEMKGSTLLHHTMCLLMKVERIALTSPAEASVAMWHHHLSSVTSPSEQGCHIEQCDWCNLTHMSPCQTCQLGNWEEEKKKGNKKKKKEKGFRKKATDKKHMFRGLFLFCVVCRSQKEKYSAEKDNRSGANQWANRSNGGLGRPSRAEKDTKQVRDASFYFNPSETLHQETEPFHRG